MTLAVDWMINTNVIEKLLKVMLSPKQQQHLHVPLFWFFIVKGEKQNQQSLTVRLTFYFKSTRFGLTKTFFRIMKMIFLATEVKKRYTLSHVTLVMSCVFIVQKIDVSL